MRWLISAEYQYNGIAQFAEQATQLSNMIAQMETKIKEALQRTEQIEQQARAGAGQLNEMNSSMSTIGKSSREMTGIVKEIRNASEEQKNASAEIVKSISGINELTQANASGALLLAESSEEILSMSDILKHSVAALDII